MDIRSEFLKFFESKGHKIIPSAPLVPDDATLLFTNAGMVPFKNIFTGKVPRPTPPIATTAQTCIRAGGKHNDLDNVGYTTRHHTFFEMLGNFSFGEYFKDKAIEYAWEFVTEVLKLPKNKLYVTVHKSDNEAFEIWKKFIAEDRIYKFDDKDNFWAMGDTGPCGYCSEIFYDQGEEHFHSDEDYMGGDGDRFLEIWNLVFMQYERDESGNLTPLPNPNIDTGMGLERVTAIKEGVYSNYDSSLFMPIIKEIEKISNIKYVYDQGASFRVISDHIRSVVFLLAQGVNFDKEGRGYVLRRILRRAIRHGYMLGIKEPFMFKLVDIVTDLMGKHYEYLIEKKESVKELIKAEEKRFLSTIAAGLDLFNEELRNTNDIFSGEVAFKLYDTYGFPFDLTLDMLREKNIKVDEEKFNELMKKQKELAKASWKGSGDEEISRGDFKELLSKFGVNKFVGYEQLNSISRILAILDENFKQISVLKSGMIGWIMLDTTPFYPGGGGQRCDIGRLDNSEVIEVKKIFDLNLCKVKAEEIFTTNQNVSAKVDINLREMVSANHSATHLLHLALRKILSSNVTQAGSSVDEFRLRFDFSYQKALSSDDLQKLEDFVNEEILKSNDCNTEIMNQEDAKNSGAVALFNEKYDDLVRVVKIGNSKELCGGTHIDNLAKIGSFYITKENGVSAGVRRIEAVTRFEAIKYARFFKNEFNEICEITKSNNPKNAVERLKNDNKKLKNEINNSSSMIEFEEINGVKFAVCEYELDIKAKIDEVKNKFDKVIIALFKEENDKVQVAIGSKGVKLKAMDIIKEIITIIDGGGGGRDDFATAGGKDVSKIPEAIKFVKEFIREKLA